MDPKDNKKRKAVSSFPRNYRGKSYNMYRLITTVGIFLIIVLLVIIAAQHVRQEQARQELEEYERRIKEYEMRKEMAELEIERLEDYHYIEVLARERLGLIKPDETIFQLED